MAELTVERFEDGVESFAKIVKEGFDAVDKRFDAVDKRFSVVDQTFGTLRGEMKAEFRRVDDRIDKLVDHVDAFIQLHQKLDIELTALRHKYDLLATRVAKLEGAPA